MSRRRRRQRSSVVRQQVADGGATVHQVPATGRRRVHHVRPQNVAGRRRRRRSSRGPVSGDLHPRLYVGVDVPSRPVHRVRRTHHLQTQTSGRRISTKGCSARASPNVPTLAGIRTPTEHTAPRAHSSLYPKRHLGWFSRFRTAHVVTSRRTHRHRHQIIHHVQL